MPAFTLPDWLHFFQRRYPSANMVLVKGRRPILVDSGFGSDQAETEFLLQQAGTPAHRLDLIVNTHYHTDHVGGNHALQARYHLPIATHRWEAQLVNQRNSEVGSALWLGQPVEGYRVQRTLMEGDELDTGEAVLQVLHTPGHTLGHISLYAPKERILICGDAVYADDVAWINIFREGAGALLYQMETLERLAQLPLIAACSGHGPLLEKPLAAIDAARRRYEKWLNSPEKLGWHSCKRILAFALMFHDGIAEAEIRPYLQQQLWLHDIAQTYFNRPAADFIEPLLDEMLRSGAAAWRSGKLVALTPYTIPPANWAQSPTTPLEWT